ncbi:1-deoxy-D-xylulose-5-phosphate reductoisomerase, partial [bacterium]
PALDLKGLRLDFAEPDLKRFPCLALAYGALERGGAAPAMLNAADEVAVEAFLKGVIGFTGIHRVIAGVLDAVGERGVAEDVQDIVEADLAARKKAVDIIKATSEKRYFS